MVKQQLSCMLSKEAIGHSLLFAGPEGIGKSLFAWALAARLIAAEGSRSEEHLDKIRLGQHPDIHIYRPEGKLGLHSIQALRQLCDEVHLPPFEANWKVFIIHDAERMLSYSANALLKTFEEPPSQTLIILLSRSQAVLLPTILSRCCTVHFRSLSVDQIETYLKEHYPSLDGAMITKIARQSRGSIGQAVRLAEQGGDATRMYLLKVLAHGPLGSYRALQEAVQTVSERIEVVRKKTEESAKEELCRVPNDQLTSQQQQGIEKELEGFVSLAMTHEAQAVFDHVLSWYRDLQLLLVGGDASQLVNLDFQEELEQAVQRGDFLPLDRVYEAVEEVNLALQRSTGFSHCLETLLLKLNRV